MDLYRSKYPRKRRDGARRSFRNSNSKGTGPVSVTCARCGAECDVPFVPRTDRPVYCRECFRRKPEGSGQKSARDKKISQDGRRESRRQDRRDERRESRSKQDRKREEFFSNGSDRFYQTLKEKLFEILGGKVCSSCGFRDERALGFCHIHDDVTFDSIRRGGAASSWRKYISDPDLARKELKVLCLNCNEIRQPMAKPKEKPRRKKSRYFPR